MLENAVFWICLLIFYFSLLKYTYHYNYRSHISLQVAKLAKSAGVQILLFPTVYAHTHAQRHTYTQPYINRSSTQVNKHTKSLISARCRHTLAGFRLLLKALECTQHTPRWEEHNCLHLTDWQA